MEVLEVEALRGERKMRAEVRGFKGEIGRGCGADGRDGL